MAGPDLTDIAGGASGNDVSSGSLGVGAPGSVSSTSLGVSGGGGTTLPPRGSGGGGGVLNWLGHELTSGPLGWVEHEVGRTASNITDAAINFFPGMYQLGGGLLHHPIRTAESVGESYVHDFQHPLRNFGNTLMDTMQIIGLADPLDWGVDAASVVGRAGLLPEEFGLAKGGLGASAEELASARKVADSLGRVSQFDRILNPATGQFNSVGRQLWQNVLHGRAPQDRFIQPPEEGAAAVKTLPYSNNPIIRSAQKLVDQAHDQFPEASIPGFWRSQSARIGKAEELAQQIGSNLDKRTAMQLKAKYGGLDDPKQLALRVSLEGTPIDEVIGMHQHYIDSGSLPPKLLKETQERLPKLEEARQYLENVTHTLPSGREETVPVIKDEFPELQKAREDMYQIAKARDVASSAAGVLQPESIIRRIVAPKNFNKYGRIPENITNLEKDLQRAKNLKNDKEVTRLGEELKQARGQLTLEGIAPDTEDLITGHLPEQRDAEGNLIAEEGDAHALVRMANLARVPYEIPRKGIPSYGSTAFRRAYTGKKQRVPGTYTHPFAAAILKGGGGRANTAELLAESYLEALRFITFKNARERMLATALDTPESIPDKYRQIMRDDTLNPNAPNYQGANEHALLTKDSLTAGDALAGGRLFKGMQDHVFPTLQQVKAELKQGDVTGAMEKLGGVFGDGTGAEGFQKVSGYKWVDTRRLGGLNKTNPLWSLFDRPLARNVLRFVDAVNNAQKDAILYLKPSYAFPNAMGNLFLNLVHQGFLAPYNLARSVIAFKAFKPEVNAGIEAAMGGGISDVLKSQGFSGLISRGSNKIANLYAKIVDDPFRYSAFLKEAGRRGFSTKAEIESLVTDPRYADQLHSVAQQANEEILNYERMSPGEQAIAKRLIFFYPWLKASTRYASYIVKNHPFAAGTIGKIGQQGTGDVERMLGKLPSFAEGLIPYETTGRGNFPVVGNPASVSILQQPADLVNLLRNVIQHNPNPDLTALQNLTPVDAAALTFGSGGALSSMPHPAAQSVIHDTLEELFGGQPIQSFIQYKQSADRPGALYPDPSFLHALSRFALFGGPTPRVMNKARSYVDWWRQTHPGVGRNQYVGGGE